MPIHPYGPVQDLSVIEEPNAYCWVDIVVQADAWVRFEGDGPSNLADPSFAAKAGATNRVIILIGKTYKVTCDMPFSVTDKSDGEIEDWWDDDQALWLNWPVEIWSESDDAERPLLLLGARNGSGGRRSGFTMHVSPLGLGGSFAWTDGCCSISGSGSHFVFDCDEDCSCNGCYATGFFSYEGYHLPVEGDSCGCGAEEEDDDDTDDPYDPLLAVGVSASFSKRVIFLENEYANTTNEVVPWHSEMTELSCVACGGMNGGHVSMTITGDSNLIRLGGQEMPFERGLEPYEVFSFTNTYKAVAESGRREDIVATASFVENLTGWTETSIAKATAVRVEVEPVVEREGCPNRHQMGIREEFFVRAYPETIASVEPASTDWIAIGASKFKCPICAADDGVQIEACGVTYFPSILAIEPIGIVCPRGFNRCSDGYIAMELEPYITPLEVCFSQIRVMEVPTNEAGPSGYFTNLVFSSIWHHSTFRGAGVWHRPGRDNFFFNDVAAFAEYCPPPLNDGVVDWLIPLAWSDDDAVSVDDVVGSMPSIYHQIFTIDAQGALRIDKFRQWIKCSADGRVTSSPGIQ